MASAANLQEGKHHLALFVDKIAMVICKGIAYLGG